jgi:hypothetical protein
VLSAVRDDRIIAPASQHYSVRRIAAEVGPGNSTAAEVIRRYDRRHISRPSRKTNVLGFSNIASKVRGLPTV